MSNSSNPSEVIDQGTASAVPQESTSASFDKKIGQAGESCIPYFDALWFCYSPVYQMKKYYTYGTVDDCTGHWGKFMDCLKTKTTRYKDDVPPDPNAGKHPLWDLRTPSEAAEFWKDEFDRISSSTSRGDGAPGTVATPEGGLGVEGGGSEQRQTTTMI